MITTENLTKSYRSGLSRSFVLRRVNLEIAEGSFVTAQGPSGAGKSTLLHRSYMCRSKPPELLIRGI
jgi:ABC-type lipoprotein export system ATPase subunit